MTGEKIVIGVKREVITLNQLAREVLGDRVVNDIDRMRIRFIPPVVHRIIRR